MGEGPCIHVLVVDDCPIDRKVVEKLLLKTGTFAVTIAGGGEKALEILGLDEENAEFANDCKIDLILTDYCMPGINGYDLLKAIKDHTSLKAIPVVIMSFYEKTLAVNLVESVATWNIFLWLLESLTIWMRVIVLLPSSLPQGVRLVHPFEILHLMLPLTVVLDHYLTITSASWPSYQMHFPEELSHI